MDSVLCASVDSCVSISLFICFHFTRRGCGKVKCTRRFTCFSFHSVSFGVTENCPHERLLFYCIMYMYSIHCTMYTQTRSVTFILFDVSQCVVIFIRYRFTLLSLNFLIGIIFSLSQSHFWSLVLFFFSTWFFETFPFFFSRFRGRCKTLKTQIPSHTTNDISNIHFF